MHHGTCVTHVPWCMSGLLARGGGENVPGACATRNFTYLARGPCWKRLHVMTSSCTVFPVNCSSDFVTSSNVTVFTPDYPNTGENITTFFHGCRTFVPPEGTGFLFQFQDFDIGSDCHSWVEVKVFLNSFLVNSFSFVWCFSIFKCTWYRENEQ